MTRWQRLRAWLLRVPECTVCGLCCAPGVWKGTTWNVDRFISLRTADVSRLPQSARREMVVHGRHKYARLRVIDGYARCTQLTGEVGKSVGCAVYANRPEACSDWVRGGRRCRQVLRWAKNPPTCSGEDAQTHPLALPFKKFARWVRFNARWYRDQIRWMWSMWTPDVQEAECPEWQDLVER